MSGVAQNLEISDGSERRVIDTIPPRVIHDHQKRSFTDAICAGAFIVTMLAFFTIGFVIIGSAHPKWEYKEISINDSKYFVQRVSTYFQEDAKECCASVGTTGSGDDAAGVCAFLDYPSEDGMRRSLEEGDDYKKKSNFDYEKGDMFEAFLAHPEIPSVLIAMVLFLAVGWVVLLRNFATPIVFATELVKVGAIIYIAVKIPDDNSKVVFCLLALGYIGLIVWKKDKLEFAGKIIEHSALAIKKNPSMFSGLIVVKGFYVLHAYLFVQFFISAVQVNTVAVKTYDALKSLSCPLDDGEHFYYCGYKSDSMDPFCKFISDEGSEESTTTMCLETTSQPPSTCSFESPSWVIDCYNFMMFAWLWAVLFYSQVRLSIIAQVVGSWHFHPDDMPSVPTAVFNSVTKSLGTIAFSSFITTIIERIKKASEVKWYYYTGPQCCLFAPLLLVSCAVKFCLETCMKMLTKFTLIIHVFTGLNFMDSAKKCFNIMSRHFENGFITDYASVSVLKLGSFVFSMAVTMSCWAWLDDVYHWQTLPQSAGETLDVVIFYLWFFNMLFNLWYPVLGIFLIIVANNILAHWLRDENGHVYGQNVWVAPMAATFVGCVSKMFFEYMAGIILDTIDVMFVCYAVDKDNNMDVSSNQFATIVSQMDGLVKANPTMDNNTNAPLLVISNSGTMQMAMPVTSKV